MSEFPSYLPVQVFWHKVLYKLNDLYTKTFPHESIYHRPSESAQEASDKIYKLLSSPYPCMIARYGSVELYCLCNYLGILAGKKPLLGFVKGEVEPWWWAPERVRNMGFNAGFFPLEEKEIVRFCQLMLEDAIEVDLLASWLSKELRLDTSLLGKDRIFLPHLEPWYAELPWTRALEGKKVLVVHPFALQMERQYALHRCELFKNAHILPPFELKTLAAVQSSGGEVGHGFRSWFDALSRMKREMDKVDYDICLIGCGAYGFPLAAYAKRSGKKLYTWGAPCNFYSV